MNVPKVAALATATVLSIALAPAARAAAPVTPYATDDYGGFRDVLPPGTNGLANVFQIGAFLATGARPAHNDDQLAMYADLVRATPGLTTETLPKYFKDSTFGVRDGDVASSVSPRGDVTIVRDAGYGVPHIYGTTRGGAMFGEGYAAAQDRLFFIDVLRHAGRAQLSSFAGGAPGNRAMDQEQWALAPYTEADLQQQIDQFDELYGADGRQLQADLADYVAGVNTYINEARLDPTKMPGEYAAIGRLLGPDPWKGTDVIATASLVGAIFGKGGGQELGMAQFLQRLQDRFGDEDGRKLWYQLAAFDDPDAPTTVKEGSFPYQQPAAQPAQGAEVLPDDGSLQPEPVVVAGTDLPSGAAGGTPPVGGLPGLLALPKSNSNALVVSAAKSKSGHPIAVFGPQVSYFAPEILMEQDVHAPTIDARGSAFAGVNLFVQLGHGRDYAWSATSAGQDIIDTFAVPTCQDSMHYRFRGRCLGVEVLERKNTWLPNAADQTAPGTQTLRTLRTKLGLVRARGTVKGKPVLFTSLRTTYRHEVDSARGFSDFNDPDKVHDAESFARAAYKIGYTFNWLYADDRDVAYFNSGNNPVRAAGTTGQLPMDPANTWNGWDPETNVADYTPMQEHPQVVNQDYITSWNNRQAQGFAGADSNLFSSVFRSQMLDRQLDERLQGGAKLDLPGLADAMEEAGTTDLRGQEVLPLALKVIGTPTDPQLAAAVDTLKAWVASGTQRRDRDGDGTYDHADAVRIMDAWWPRWLEAQFRPTLGATLFATLPHGQDNTPNNHGDHLGSAYQEGWYGYAAKDLRTLLGEPVKQQYARTFCGKGVLADCRTLLRQSLKAALTVPASELYSGDATCQKANRDGDQTCFDAVSFRALGAITQPLIPWINRPTYQQAVEIGSHRPR
ncbi:MAG TPA: penicillin acylase family protein [Baekduia sp.]|uniref:penicillin acylase family protein n=1 Tax=Baekduia sp. TaxID=2600305 RepID=UPI002B66858E|nr:penicillin acylase family protein [Baekduia sp.]HMJ35325.1 penicillin acylase family protein [Baekduia sp.]